MPERECTPWPAELRRIADDQYIRGRSEYDRMQLRIAAEHLERLELATLGLLDAIGRDAANLTDDLVAAVAGVRKMVGEGDRGGVPAPGWSVRWQDQGEPPKSRDFGADEEGARKWARDLTHWPCIMVELVRPDGTAE